MVLNLCLPLFVRGCNTRPALFGLIMIPKCIGPVEALPTSPSLAVLHDSTTPKGIAAHVRFHVSFEITFSSTSCTTRGTGKGLTWRVCFQVRLPVVVLREFLVAIIAFMFFHCLCTLRRS
jgi:hypothetical protein